SEGVYFTTPPDPSLKALPGKWITAVTSAPTAPAMVGEFSGKDGAKFAMLVNLSQERSSYFTIKHSTSGVMQSISPADGTRAPVEEDQTPLPAGQGVLLELGQ